MDYTTLGLDYWTLFACTRLILWGNFTAYKLDGFKQDYELCQLTRETALLKYCQNERAKDWDAYCAIVHTQGMEIDCYNANKEAKRAILNTLAKQRGSQQYRCAYGS